jgi:hypothetical protein
LLPCDLECLGHRPVLIDIQREKTGGFSNKCPGKRPQTTWGSGRIMYENVVVDDDDDD